MTGIETAARIVLIEDHAVLREALRGLLELEPQLEVVGEAGNVADGIRVVESTQPTLVITDIVLPGGSGLDAVGALRAAGGGARLRVLVLTAHFNDEYIAAALSAGADGYVLKDATRAELLRAIRTIIAGQKYFSERVAARLVSGYLRRSEPTGDARRLTEREQTVLRRIAEGESNKLVARSLSLSVKTIEKHRASLMRKLALRNTAAITLYAVRHGFVGTQSVEASFGT